MKKETFMDLVYFGYEWEEGSKESEKEFIREVKEKFPDARIMVSR